jgi:hypothetical protein
MRCLDRQPVPVKQASADDERQGGQPQRGRGDRVGVIRVLPPM